MKKKHTIAITAALLAVALAVAGCTSAQPAGSAPQSSENQGKPSITAAGKGEITVMPDVAYINVGVTTQNVKAQAAAEENSEKMKALHAALKELGIEDSDIKTVNFSLYPQYNYNAPEPSITSYTSSNVVRITVKDIDIVSNVIDAMTKAGATDFQGVSFDLLDKSEAYSEALTKAIQNAKEKVDVMAGAIGVTEIAPVRFIENSTDSYPIYEKAYSGAGGMGGGGGADTPVSAGQLTVMASVTVEYEIVK